MRTYWVYILRCADGSYYTGVTNNIERRLTEHQQGLHPTSFTFLRRPVELVYTEYSHDVLATITREKQLQGWSRKKKEALIDGQEGTLPELAKRQTPQKPSYQPKRKPNLSR